MAGMYPIIRLLKLPRQACQDRKHKSLQISNNKGEAAISLPTHRTEHCSSFQCQVGSTQHHAASHTRQQSATHRSHSLQTKPLFSPKRITAPAAGAPILGIQLAQSRSQGCTMPQVKERATLLGLRLQPSSYRCTSQHSSQELVRVCSGRPEPPRRNADTAL